MRDRDDLARRLTVLAGWALGAAALVTACGGGGLETSKAEEQITAQLRRTYAPVSVADVGCPREVPRRKGGTFECHTEVAGTPVVVDARQVDDEGSVKVALDHAVVFVDKVRADLTAQLTAAWSQKGEPATVPVDCGAEDVRVLAPGASFVCMARTPLGAQKVKVLIEDAAGRVSYRPVS